MTHEGPLPTEISTQGIELAINKLESKDGGEPGSKMQWVWESSSEARSSPLAPTAPAQEPFPIHVSRKGKFRLSKVPA